MYDCIVIGAGIAGAAGLDRGIGADHRHRGFRRAEGLAQDQPDPGHRIAGRPADRGGDRAAAAGAAPGL